jgi:hypothetical protein
VEAPVPEAQQHLALTVVLAVVELRVQPLQVEQPIPLSSLDLQVMPTLVEQETQAVVASAVLELLELQEAEVTE